MVAEAEGDACRIAEGVDVVTVVVEDAVPHFHLAAGAVQQIFRLDGAQPDAVPEGDVQASTGCHGEFGSGAAAGRAHWRKVAASKRGGADWLSQQRTACPRMLHTEQGLNERRVTRAAIGEMWPKQKIVRVRGLSVDSRSEVRCRRERNVGAAVVAGKIAGNPEPAVQEDRCRGVPSTETRALWKVCVAVSA